MAKTFKEQAGSYEKIELEQGARLAAAGGGAVTDTISSSSAAPRAVRVSTASLEALHADPGNRSALEGMQRHYELAGRPSVAAYFRGRVLQLDHRGEHL
jgi:hypothetical protein